MVVDATWRAEQRRLSRRALGRVAGALALCAAVGEARADAGPVPVPLQMKLLAKVAGYDKNLVARAGGRVVLAIVTRDGDTDSERVAALARSSLSEVKDIGGVPLEVVTETWSSPAVLKKAIATRRLAIVYFTPGLQPADVEGVARALDGTDVLTATAIPTQVPRGVVLGFDLVSGKPKLVVHLAQAKKQRVALPADVLKLAQVIE